MRAVAPALALGNAVVLKPDPRTAVSSSEDGGADYWQLWEESRQLRGRRAATLGGRSGTRRPPWRGCLRRASPLPREAGRGRDPLVRPFGGTSCLRAGGLLAC
ncbi:hypothetical protein [Streptomyces sp. NPDC096132]|uniref:hypothetical protein n=1 Tax=Streptomyces sp. NPDC096132 TaxID=3366075 RepID=UPI0037FB22AB